MKHIIYLIYVLSYSGAVFISGMFMGQWLERAWSRREQRARVQAAGAQVSPITMGLQDATSAKAGDGK